MSAPTKVSTLAQTLARLKRSPKVIIPTSPTNGIRSLRMTLAKRNAHFGARHFLKEELPRIAYSNPNLSIAVELKEHLKENPWTPEIRVEFLDGKHATLDMTMKHSTAILQELIDLTGAKTEIAPNAST